ncbi:MAG: PKD domain-containing protein, partial [Thermoplasmata archaeon]
QTSTSMWPLGRWGSQKLGANEINGICEFEFYLVKDSGSGSVELNFTLYVCDQTIASVQSEFSGVNTTIKKYNASVQVSDFVLNSGSQIILEIKSRTSSQGISFVYGSNVHASCVKLPFYSPINILPIAKAGSDISAKLNETVYFDATNSTDPDGSIVGYKWNFGDPYCVPSSNTANTPKPSHTYTREGKYTVTLNVTDNAGGVSSSSLTVTVTVENAIPVILSYSPAQNSLVMNENETLLFNVTATDANGDMLSYQWYLDKQKLTGKTTREYSYTASYASAGNHTIKVEVSDGKATVSHTWNVTVLNVNLPPELVAYEPAYNTVITNETTSVRFAVNVRDVDENFGLRYLWFVDGNQVYGESANSYTYLEEADFKSNGTHTIMVIVYDSEGASVTMAWTVYVANVNRAPECSMEIEPKGSVFNEGTTITASAKVSDLDGDKLTLVWFLDCVQIGTGSSISIELAEKGMHEIKVVVTDAYGANATA